MALNRENRQAAIDLMASESNFERSGISGQQCRKDAAPRQEEMPPALYGRLMGDIARDNVAYVIFSYRTVIAWVYRNGGVNLPDVKYSTTTTQHQNMVREAYGPSRINQGIPVVKDEAPVVLTENEEVILRRMRDEDGTEFGMIMGFGRVPNCKMAPRDQVEPLISKGLLAVRESDSGVADLTQKGRDHLNKVTPLAARSGLAKLQEDAKQYSDLTEDEMIGLLAEFAETYGDHLKGIPADMATIALALNERRKATADSRSRVGEYLRQHMILEDKYQADLKKQEEDKAEGRRSYGTPKQPSQVLDEIRTDEYAGTARLRITDLQRLVPTLVRDSKTSFYAEQATRLGMWEDSPLVTEKQAALLPCIAKGHITAHGSGSYSGKSGGWREEDRCTCTRPDGRTISALLKKKVITSRLHIGFNTGSTLMLKRPEGQ